MKEIEKAMRLMDENKVDAAIKLIDQAIPILTPDMLYSVAEWYMQLGFLEQANKILLDLLNRFPEEKELKALIADNYIELGNDAKAIELFDQADISDPEDPFYLQMIMQQADLYESQGLFEVAEQKLLEAKRHFPSEKVIDFALGELSFSIGKYSAASKYYENVLSEHKILAEVSLVERLAESHAALGHYEIALSYYEKIDDEHADLLFKHGLTASRAKRFEVAIHKWKKLIDLDPSYHSVYYQLAQAYEEEQLLEEAYTTVIKGLDHDEFNKELYFYAGKLAHALNKTEESEKYIREAIVLDSDYKEAILFLVGLFKESEEYEKIIDLLEAIQLEGSNDPLYHWELARAYNANEEYDMSLNQYEEAYTHLHDDSEFLKEYGYFLVEDGKVKKAIAPFQKYLELEVLDDETRAFVDRLLLKE